MLYIKTNRNLIRGGDTDTCMALSAGGEESRGQVNDVYAKEKVAQVGI